MQLEMILGFLLMTQLTKMYNSIVLLYDRYKYLYDDIKNMLSTTQTEEVAIHDGIFNIKYQSPIGYGTLVGIRNGIIYWTNSSSNYEDISDGLTTWSISITNWRVISIALTSSGWLVMYGGKTATVESGKKRFKLYDTSFTATTIDLTVDGLAINKSCKSVIGYDGTSVYCSGSTGPSFFGSAVSVVDIITGAITYQDSKMGLMWGADFYPMDDTFIYASKPIYAPFIYGCCRNGWVRNTGVVQYGFQVGQLSLGGDNYHNRYVLFFDGTYVYRLLQSECSTYGVQCRVTILQKQIF